MTPAEILTEARRLIEEKGWAQGGFAFNWRGEPVGVFHPSAERFCSLGALMRSWEGASESERREARLALVGGVSNSEIALWNDRWNRTKPEVLAAFDRAIALANGATK